MNILLTGSAGHFAQCLLPYLCAHEQITSITGIDVKSSAFKHRKFQEFALDVRSKKLISHLKGIDAVIHLAFVVLRQHLGKQRHDRELMRDINVNGTRNVVAQALSARVNHFIHLSSVAVYGAWADNPDYVDEQQPLRPNPGFAYAEDKTHIEHWLESVAMETDMRIIRLRPHAILGKQALPFLRFLLRQPFYPKLRDPQPLTQCVWEDDVARAVLAALFSDTQGAFNLAAQPALAFRSMLKYKRRFALPIPLALAKTANNLAWRLGGPGEDPAWMEGMRFSLAVDCKKAERQLNWQAQKNTYQCLDLA